MTHITHLKTATCFITISIAEEVGDLMSRPFSSDPTADWKRTDYLGFLLRGSVKTVLDGPTPTHRMFESVSAYSPAQIDKIGNGVTDVRWYAAEPNTVVVCSIFPRKREVLEKYYPEWLVERALADGPPGVVREDSFEEKEGAEASPSTREGINRKD